MGIGMWIAAGFVAAIIASQIPYGRPSRRSLEVIAALIAAVVAGLAATALDFGGWRELDWRAALFAGVCALAVVGILRAVRMRTLYEPFR